MSRHSTGQTGEYLVAAELARRGYTVAIPTGNAPALDILAYKDGKTFAIQVKAVAKGSHQFNLGKFVDIEFTDDGRQVVNGPLDSIDRNLILALAFIGEAADSDKVLWATVGELADLLAVMHKDYLDRLGGRRPRSPRSLHASINKDVFIDNFGSNSIDEVFYRNVRTWI